MLSTGLTSRWLDVVESSSKWRNRKRGRGNMNASYHVSADSQWVLVFTYIAGWREAERRSGVDTDAFNREARDEGLRCGGTFLGVLSIL